MNFFTSGTKVFRPGGPKEAAWSEPYIALSKVICLSNEDIPSAAAA